MNVVPRVMEQKAQDDALLLASGHGSCVSLSDSSLLLAFTDVSIVAAGNATSLQDITRLRTL